ncbi:MAG: hypothetical protein M9894_25585 [Planctomycetes bacterium]|nr:hypothetical protein [Planctomycetota bacterium]
MRVGGARPSLRGVGKVVEGEYEASGDLRAALVDAEGREAWFPAGDLVRVLPPFEAVLCTDARDRGLLGDERARGLLDRLARYVEGRLEFLRSPGLLDRLWSLSSRADPDHGSSAISAFLDGAGLVLAQLVASADPQALDPGQEAVLEEEHLDDRRAARRRRREQRRRERHEALLARYPPEVVELARRARDADLAERARVQADELEDDLAEFRVLFEARVLPTILGVLDEAALLDLVRALGPFLPPAALQTSERLRQELTRLAPPIEEVVGALADDDLLAACSAVGIEVLDQDLDVLRVRLVGHTDPEIATLWWMITVGSRP